MCEVSIPYLMHDWQNVTCDSVEYTDILSVNTSITVDRNVSLKRKAKVVNLGRNLELILLKQLSLKIIIQQSIRLLSISVPVVDGNLFPREGRSGWRSISLVVSLQHSLRQNWLRGQNCRLDISKKEVSMICLYR